jgi:hypothetical protein
MAVKYHKTTSRRPWMARTIPEIIRKEGRSLTMAQIAAALNLISNPSDSAPRVRGWKKQPWEYHIGVQSYPEIATVLNRLIAKFVVERDNYRRRHDPKDGRKRYALANPLVALAGCAAEEPQTPSEPEPLPPEASAE